MFILRLLRRTLKWTCLVLGGLTLIVVMLGIAGAWLWEDRGPVLPDRMILSLDLSQGFDTGKDGPLAALDPHHPARFTQILSALDRAGSDPRVEGLVVYAGTGDLGMAEVQELGMAVQRFRREGKPAYVFAESFGETGNGTLHYLLATNFDRIFVQPSGEVGLKGFLIETPYARSLLDDLGIIARIGAREQYKGAPASLTDKEMPAPVRQNLQKLVDDWQAQSVAQIAVGLTLSDDAARAIFVNGPYRASEARDKKLVDDLSYRDQAEDALLDKVNQIADAAKKDPFPAKQDSTSVHDYARSLPDLPEKTPAIAVIEARGAIMYGSPSPFNGDEAMIPDEITDAFDRALDDKAIKLIIFRIDSPGGSYAASDTIAHAINRAQQQNIPVIMSMGNVAASGGYLIAVAGDKIAAAPGTITGSIGVFSGKVVLRGFWQGLGVNWDHVASSENATADSANVDFSDQQWAKLQGDLDAIYGEFLDRVAEGRDLSVEQVRAVAGGQVWSGATARAQGLVDRDDGWFGALAEARNMLKLQEDAPLDVRYVPLGDHDFFAFAREFMSHLRAAAKLGILMDGWENISHNARKNVSLGWEN